VDAENEERQVPVASAETALGWEINERGEEQARGGDAGREGRAKGESGCSHPEPAHLTLGRRPAREQLPVEERACGQGCPASPWVGEPGGPFVSEVRARELLDSWG
jgi:hypothetical protein